MRLLDIVNGLNYKVVNGDINITINKVEYNSKNIKNNDVFVCIKGFETDGHKYIENAIENGAIAIICEDDINVDLNVTVIKMENTREGMAKIAANYYNEPSKSLKLIGITGTNGKTTTAFMMKSCLEQAGKKVGLIGTIANYIGDKKIDATRTTPESLELNELLREMVDSGVEYCVMEVSSHSLALDRVKGITFEYGLFLNLTQDHLDFHNTFEEYFKAKLKIFDISKKGVVNIDDTYGNRCLTEGASIPKISFGLNEECDIKADNVNVSSDGVSFNICLSDKNEKFIVDLPGRYNAYNALAVISVLNDIGIDNKFIKKALSEVQVPGRCENVSRKHNLPFQIIIDYAHSPDGLEKILKTAREFTDNRLISIFGCGGNRDKLKRPIMGKIGMELSDLAIITSDNPRNEDPMSIINDIVQGQEKDNYIVIESRREAIKEAIRNAQKGDVIVIAGKGHEDYQIFKNNLIVKFDERIIVDEILKELDEDNAEVK